MTDGLLFSGPEPGPFSRRHQPPWSPLAQRSGPCAALAFRGTGTGAQFRGAHRSSTPKPLGLRSPSSARGGPVRLRPLTSPWRARVLRRPRCADSQGRRSGGQACWAGDPGQESHGGGGDHTFSPKTVLDSLPHRDGGRCGPVFPAVLPEPSPPASGRGQTGGCRDVAAPACTRQSLNASLPGKSCCF